MKHFLAILTLGAVMTAPAASQNLFRATLDGAQETPPVVTSAGGWGTVTLNGDSSVTYFLDTWGLTATAAHIHVGAVGVPGGVLVPLVGGPTSWSGTSAPLSAADVAALRTEGLYFNVHTALHPGGEIRGQILIAPKHFSVTCTGAQETPPNGSTAIATGTLVVNPDRSITYDIASSGLTATAAHIHFGLPGVPGGVLFPLSPGPSLWAGTTPPMTEAQYADFQNLGMYVNIHTAMFPGGEIRGQIIRTNESYGFGCDGGGAVDCTLDSMGAPIGGHQIRLQISNGLPGGSGFLGISLSPDAELFNGCQRLIGLPTVRTMPVSLNASGARAIHFNLPMLGASTTAYLQYGGFSGGGLVYTSNGLALRVEVL